MDILVLHPGALGDMILSLPAIGLLRSRMQSARITIAGNLDYLVPVASGYADRLLSLSTLPLHRLYTEEEIPPEEVSFWKSYAKIISWTGWGHPVFTRRLREIHPDARIEPWKPFPGDARHVSRIFADSLGPEFSGRELGPARISVDPKAAEEGRQWLLRREWNEGETLIAVHPGAGSREKRWPPENFIRLARHFLSQDRTLLVIEGPAEPGSAQTMVRALASDRVISVTAVPLNLLAAILETCRLFMGNDSGLAHLAAALGVPCVVLFGPTLPQHWAPLGAWVTALRNPQECAGCAAGGNRHTCLENITVEEVIRSMLNRSRF